MDVHAFLNSEASGLSMCLGSLVHPSFLNITSMGNTDVIQKYGNTDVTQGRNCLDCVLFALCYLL